MTTLAVLGMPRDYPGEPAPSSGNRKPSRLFLHDAVRWAVHELRRLCPEPELGTRTLAAHLVRAGLRISRASVQRILREPDPKRHRPRGRLIPPASAAGCNLLRPKRTNRVWHLDLTSLRLLWRRFAVAAIIDGRSRKLLALKAYPGAPNARQMLRLVRHAVGENGRPRFLITDHGCQFRKAFRNRIESLGVRHVQGRVRCPAVNAKVERFFRTFRLWLRVVLLPWSARRVQKRLERFQHWYNHHRPHSALGCRTPDEAVRRRRLAAPRAIRAADLVDPLIALRRRCCRGDPSLPILDIEVTLRPLRAA